MFFKIIRIGFIQPAKQFCSQRKSACKFAGRRTGSRGMIHKLAALLRLSVDKINRPFNAFAIKRILGGDPHPMMVSVIGHLVKHPVRPGVQFEQKIQPPSGFVQNIRYLVGALQSACLLFIRKGRRKVPVSRQEVPGGIGRR